MLSNLVSQLTAQKAVHRYEEVLREIPRVREDMGFPPLVTPLSQMVGTQAVFNVLTGERYKMVPKEIKDLVKGLYGNTPALISEDIIKKIVGQEELFTGRPADLILPEFDKLKNEISDYAKSEEDVLIYAMFPQVARTYFENRDNNMKKESKVQTINIVF